MTADSFHWFNTSILFISKDLLKAQIKALILDGFASENKIA